MEIIWRITFNFFLKVSTSSKLDFHTLWVLPHLSDIGVQAVLRKSASSRCSGVVHAVVWASARGGWQWLGCKESCLLPGSDPALWWRAAPRLAPPGLRENSYSVLIQGWASWREASFLVGGIRTESWNEGSFFWKGSFFRKMTGK